MLNLFFREGSSRALFLFVYIWKLVIQAFWFPHSVTFCSLLMRTCTVFLCFRKKSSFSNYKFLQAHCT
uniref:Uncharacterized protein n=1 Tax=Arundo donax TaxID=35708 RepID=A0A0A9BMS6_ARUDO